MKDLFTIGEVARLFSVNIRTLRYYDEIGILSPETVSQETGYRYYSTRQFERLNTIKYLRVLGMPLKKITLFFENRDVEILRGLLEEQRQETKNQIMALRRIERKLDSRLAALDDAVTAPLGQIREITFAKRRIAMFHEAIPLGDDLEYPIRKLERANRLEPAIFLGKVGVSIAAGDLRRRRFGQFSGVFVFLEEGESGGDGIDADSVGNACGKGYLPAGSYLTLRFGGTHLDAARYYGELLDYAGNRGYTLAGDSVEVTLIDAGFTNDTGRYVTEIQIPVTAAR